MQIFWQYCYSAILNIELHCSKYCKKIIIFYLSLSLSSVSHLSSLSLQSPSPNLISVSPISIAEPSTISRHPQQPPATQHHRAQPLHRRTQNPQPSTISCHPHGETNTAIHNPRSTTHEFAIHDPRSTIGAVRVRVRHGVNEVLGFIETK